MKEPNDLENIKPSKELDDRVLKFAKHNIEKALVFRNFKTLAPLGFVCYLLGVLSIQIFTFSQGFNQAISPFIELPQIKFRGGSQSNATKIDLRTLSKTEINDLITELLANNDTKQALQVIKWIEENS